ncbi:MAG TPA: RNA polymerase sigma factor [Candidatus Acetothermia bacterium]|nr:RNA polymerase sigma factor [Candidatus Acetothermia bacterium]
MAHEREWLARVARKDEASFQRLYEEFATRIFRYALTLLRDHHLAEEVVQETMITVWSKASTYAGNSRVSTWIFGIARHKAYDILNGEKKAGRATESRAIMDDPAPAIERQERVHAAMKGLPPDQREIVFLTFYENLSYKAIANLLEIPEGTVKSRMYHAKKKLAEALT